MISGFFVPVCQAWLGLLFQYCNLKNSVCVLVPVADDQISVKVNESGWAWMVCGERLIIWKICQTAVAKVQFSPRN